jgi:hypothetical protein
MDEVYFFLVAINVFMAIGWAYATKTKMRSFWKGYEMGIKNAEFISKPNSKRGGVDER